MHDFGSTTGARHLPSGQVDSCMFHCCFSLMLFTKEGSLEPQLWGQWKLPFQIRQYVKLNYLA